MKHEISAIVWNADIYSILFNVRNKSLYMWTNRFLTNKLIGFINPYRFSHRIYPIDHSTLQTIAKMLVTLGNASSRYLSRSVMGGEARGYQIVCRITGFTAVDLVPWCLFTIYFFIYEKISKFFFQVSYIIKLDKIMITLEYKLMFFYTLCPRFSLHVKRL